METTAAVLWPDSTEWTIEPVRLDPPGAGEVLVRMVAAGLCHSDAHLVHGGYAGLRRPIVGGHEGAGVVEAVGDGVTSLRPDDHVVLSYMPSCGCCSACTAGMQHLCERGQFIGQGFQLADGTARHHARGEDLSLFCLLGAFAGHTVVHEASCVRVDSSLPLDELCILGCAGVTGWGAAVHTAGVRPGHTTMVVGVGGIGAMAIKGARAAGAAQVIAIDPVPGKRTAAVALGADRAFESMAAALEPVRDLTEGRMANQAIMAIGVGDGRLLAQALALVGKQGRVVIVNVHPAEESTASVQLKDLQAYEKQVVGCLGGTWPPRRGIAELADLRARGRLQLDDVVTARYALADLRQGYVDLAAGVNLRGVVTQFE